MANSAYTVLIQQMANPNGAPTISVQAPMPETVAFDVGATYDQPLLPGSSDKGGVISKIMKAMGVRGAVQAMSVQLWSGNTETELTIEMDFHTESDPIADVRTPILNLMKLVVPGIGDKSGLLSSPGPYVNFTVLGAAIANSASTVGAVAGGLAGSAVSVGKNIVSGALGTANGTPPTTGSLNNTALQTNDGANNSQAATPTANNLIGTSAFWKSQIKNQISIRIGNYLYFDSVVVTRVSKTYTSNFDAQTGLPHHARVAVTFKPLFMLCQSDLESLYINPTGTAAPSTNSFTMPGANVGPSSNSFNFTL